MRERSKRTAAPDATSTAVSPVLPHATAHSLNATPQHEDPRIWKLWDRWAPILLMRGIQAHQIDRIREDYRRSLTGLLRAGVSIRKIELLKLDDPRLSSTDRNQILSVIQSNE